MKDDINGILLVDKPAGWTSHDVVAKIRSILNKQQRLLATHGSKMQGAGEKRTESYIKYDEGVLELATQQLASSQNRAVGSANRQVLAVRRPKVKVGHTGTLDPAATGLLILVIGSFTKRAAEFSKLDKVYEASLVLGAVSSTGDREGEITQKSHKKPSKQQVLAVLKTFEGQIQQTPHTYSAVKINGQRAYKLARAGKEVELEPRVVNIHGITDVDYRYPGLKFKVKVSSGTYVRSLAEDIGQKLGTGAYLSALRRIKVGVYDVEGAIKIDNLDGQALTKHIKCSTI